MSKVALYSRLAGEPAVRAGWYITCPDAHIGPYPTCQAAHSATARTGRHCAWPHQVTHLPAPNPASQPRQEESHP